MAHKNANQQCLKPPKIQKKKGVEQPTNQQTLFLSFSSYLVFLVFNLPG